MWRIAPMGGGVEQVVMERTESGSVILVLVLVSTIHFAWLRLLRLLAIHVVVENRAQSFFRGR
jgi:hypothetical protein